MSEFVQAMLPVCLRGYYLIIPQFLRNIMQYKEFQIGDIAVSASMSRKCSCVNRLEGQSPWLQLRFIYRVLSRAILSSQARGKPIAINHRCIT